MTSRFRSQVKWHVCGEYGNVNRRWITRNWVARWGKNRVCDVIDLKMLWRRYYYDKGILNKTKGKKYAYQFNARALNILFKSKIFSKGESSTFLIFPDFHLLDESSSSPLVTRVHSMTYPFDEQHKSAFRLVASSTRSSTDDVIKAPKLEVKKEEKRNEKKNRKVTRA